MLRQCNDNSYFVMRYNSATCENYTEKKKFAYRTVIVVDSALDCSKHETVKQ